MVQEDGGRGNRTFPYDGSVARPSPSAIARNRGALPELRAHDGKRGCVAALGGIYPVVARHGVVSAARATSLRSYRRRPREVECCMRADAQRNRRLLLDAACRVFCFVEVGTEAPLELIASCRRRPAARSATPGAQDDVGDVRGAGWRVDARLDRVQLDREVVAEQPAEVVGTDVVRWVEALRLHVRAVLVVEVGRRRAATRPGSPCRATSARRARRRPWAAPGTGSTRGRTSGP